MAQVLTLINGIPKMVDESGSTDLYHETIEIVASNPTGNQLIGPVLTGTNITLPNSGTYEGEELEVFVNKFVQEDVLDFIWVGTGSKTQIQFTFDLEVGDVIVLRKTRNL